MLYLGHLCGWVLFMVVVPMFRVYFLGQSFSFKPPANYYVRRIYGAFFVRISCIVYK